MKAGPLRGLSLVELLVALALGLATVAAVAALLVAQIGEHQRLLADVRLMQDLRTMSDLVARELRRAGHWPGDDLSGQSSPQAALWPPAGSPAAAAVGYSYARGPNADAAPAVAADFHGFRLNTRTQVLQMRQSGAAVAPADGDSWQPLNDPQAVRVTAFSVVHQTQSEPLRQHCDAEACPAGSAACEPVWTASFFDIQISASDARDPALARTLRTQVRPRSGRRVGQCPP